MSTRKTLLVVDDDEAMLRAVVRMTAKSGLQVLTASTLAAAFPHLQSASVDLLLTDLSLHVGEGTELLQLVQNNGLKTRCMLMSGNCGEQTERLAFQLGATDVLAKPFQEEELLAAIKRALDPPEGFFGELCQLTLMDVLQLYNLGHRSLKIEISGPRGAQLFMEHGQVVHAVVGSLTGEPAFKQILGMTNGRLRSSPQKHAPAHTITRRFDALLLDGLRVNEEKRREQLSTRMRELKLATSRH